MNTKDSAKSKNLLPNASFEPDFGQAKHEWVHYNPGEGVADNWTDMFNPMTMPLAARHQVPEAWPVIEAAAAAPDGQRAMHYICRGLESPGCVSGACTGLHLQ